MAIECTLNPARLSVPLPPTPIRSKIRPTSIANGSSLGPTKTFVPSPSVVMACWRTGSYPPGKEFLPTLLGAVMPEPTLTLGPSPFWLHSVHVWRTLRFASSIDLIGPML